MSWNGDSRNFDFTIKAARKEFIEQYAELIGGEFPDAIGGDLKIEARPLNKEVNYYESHFSFSYPLNEMLNAGKIESIFPGFYFFQELLPWFVVRIEMVIVRANLNEYTYSTREEVFYLCSPVIKTEENAA